MMSCPFLARTNFVRIENVRELLVSASGMTAMKKASIGIVAFGSLIDNPGREIEAALVGRKLNVRTPFGVEFARSSTKRGGAPTLVSR
jgi:hypothetical protein